MYEDVFLPIIVVFIVIGLPILCGTMIVLKVLSRKDRSKQSAEEVRVIQELNRSLSQLETRIESLETLMTARESAQNPVSHRKDF